MCEGSDVNAVIEFSKIPQLEGVKEYLELGCVPGVKLLERQKDFYIEVIE